MNNDDDKFPILVRRDSFPGMVRSVVRLWQAQLRPRRPALRILRRPRLGTPLADPAPPRLPRLRDPSSHVRVAALCRPTHRRPGRSRRPGLVERHDPRSHHHHRLPRSRSLLADELSAPASARSHRQRRPSALAQRSELEPDHRARLTEEGLAAVDDPDAARRESRGQASLAYRSRRLGAGPSWQRCQRRALS